MTRCPACSDVVSRIPHTRSDASECDGRERRRGCPACLGYIDPATLQCSSCGLTDAQWHAREPSRLDSALHEWGERIAEALVPFIPDGVVLTPENAPIGGIVVPPMDWGPPPSPVQPAAAAVVHFAQVAGAPVIEPVVFIVEAALAEARRAAFNAPHAYVSDDASGQFGCAHHAPVPGEHGPEVAQRCARLVAAPVHGAVVEPVVVVLVPDPPKGDA